MCAQRVRCAAWADDDLAGCVTRYVSEHGDLGRGMARGSIRPNARARACVEALSTVSCLANPPEACFGIRFEGQLADGAACSVSAECAAPGSVCGGGPVCGRVCAPLGSEGHTCGQYPCRAGLFCDFTVARCAPLRANGAACASDDECAEASGCGNGRCLQLPPPGEACLAGIRPCAGGAHCGTAGLCVASVPAGASCLGDGECLPGHVCARGLCRDGRRGASCLPSECAGWLACDEVLRTCQPGVVVTEPGGACTGSVQRCDRPMLCRGASVNPDGGPGATGLCGQLQPGDPCWPLGECPPLLTCVAGTCQTAVTGSTCEWDWECPPTDSCVDRRCVPRLPLDAACNPSGLEVQCVLGAVCGTLDLQPDTWQCRAQGSAGTPCRSGGQPAERTRCLPPFTCVGGMCTHAGNTGEPCLDGRCAEGVCWDPDAGSAPFPRGVVCGPTLPDDSLCTSDQQCTSGRCHSETFSCATTCP